MRTWLFLLCLFTAAAGIWLASMETILRHEGYGVRIAVACFIAVQSAATLLFERFGRQSPLRPAVMAGSASLVLLGGTAVLRILQASHFEGFVLIIGLALMLQGALAIATLVRYPGVPQVS